MLIAFITVTGCDFAPAVFESTYPEFWTANTWKESGVGDDVTDYNPEGSYHIMLEIGLQGDLADAPDYFTEWEQDHNPFTATTDGSDYTYIDGDEPTTCGGFNGLHNRHFREGAGSGIKHARTSDVDSTDSVGCWTMQVVPLEEYRGTPGYLHGYEGILGEHVWQRLEVTPL